MADLNTLTPMQKDALGKMREAFSTVDGEGLPMSEATFLRYLRARSFDVAAATTLLQATIKWRRDFDIKSIHDGWASVIEEENKTGKGYVRGYSNAGNVLLYLKPKHENTFNHDGNLKHLVYNMERAVKCMDADGRGAEKLILLIDYDGYSLLNAPPMKTSTETLSILQNHYPERLFRAYCIRPPWIFNAFWTIISPFIDPITCQKIVMVNGSTADVGAKLKADGIDLSSLEADIGGTDTRPFSSSVYLGSHLPRSSSVASSVVPGDCAAGVAGSTTSSTSSGEPATREELFNQDFTKLLRGDVRVAPTTAESTPSATSSKSSWFW